MSLKNHSLVIYKLFFALLGFSALVTEIATIVERRAFDAGNFFSYFTVEVNIIVCVTFLLSALSLTGNYRPKWLDILRCIATVYILVVGIGFAILLSGFEGIALTAVPWDNTVLHYLIPIAVLVDFLIDRPKRNITLKSGLVWVLFPIAYVFYSLLRGSITGWYPYPFLNPNTNGLDNVLLVVACLVGLGLLIITVITYLTRHKMLQR
jgi:hypothetical protein